MMAKRKRVQRGGWPKRERAAIALRVGPELADWYLRHGRAAGRSRNSLMELWLHVLKDVVEGQEKNLREWEAQGRKPADVPAGLFVKSLGESLAGKMATLGFFPETVRRGLFEENATEGVREN